MNPTSSNLNLTTNYDNHVITLHDVTFSNLNPSKGTITGPVHNHEIDFSHVAVEKEHLFSGCFGQECQIVLVVTYDESVEVIEWKMKIVILNKFSDSFALDDMDTCVFNEVMPMKGVHDG
jgi:hypothetical protein